VSRACNVLLTFSGLKNYVREILAHSAHAGEILAADSDPLAPIGQHGGSFHVVPRVVDEAAYVASLMRLCTRQRVDCLLPLNDLDLAVLAREAPRFEDAGTRVLGAPEDVVAATRDKLAMASWLAQRGLPSPPTALAGDGQEFAARHGWPLIAKARSGQGSERLRLVRDVRELAQLDAHQVIQPLRRGVEHNLDILRDPRAGVLSVVPKRKLEMRNGSTHHAVSVESPQLVELGVRLGEALRHAGTADVDVMVGEHEAEILDVNTRVGGGFPYTAMCCPEYVDALLLVGLGESPQPFLGRYQRGVRGFRDVVYLRGREEAQP
jgi:carbamoyl-phosphate synthase large subunit